MFYVQSLSEIVLYKNKFPSEITNKIVNRLKNMIEEKTLSSDNKFFNSKVKKSKSRFHALYYACWLLSKNMADMFEVDEYNTFNVDSKNNIHQGSIFTMLLNSIDIDFINDKGSGTLHSNEPIQAVYLNSSKKENVVLIGTFKNIFNYKKTSVYDIFPTPESEQDKFNRPATMNKIVNILEKNPQLNDLFDTELFDDVQLESDIRMLRKKAWQDLTKKELKIAKFINFHSTNSIFKFNMYQQKGVSDLDLDTIVFDIGLKEEFLNSSFKEQLEIIEKEMPKIVKIEDNLTYIQVFLSKYRKKNIYRIKDPADNFNLYIYLNKIQDHAANFEWFSLKSDEEKTRFITVKVFINICEEISQLSELARHQ